MRDETQQHRFRGAVLGNRPARLALAIAALTLVVSACQAGAALPLAGTGSSGSAGDGGPAKSATLETPGAVVASPAGAFYVADDAACTVRRITANGVITTIAGTGTCGYSGDGGAATAAQLDPSPSSSGVNDPAGGLALDAAGNLYLADVGNCRIREITTGGTISTIAGSGASGPSCHLANNLNPIAIAVSPSGTVFVNDGFEVSKVLAGGALQALFNPGITGPGMGLAIDATGNLYYSEGAGSASHQLLRWSPTTQTSTEITSISSVLANLAVDDAGYVYGAVMGGSSAGAKVLRVSPGGVVATIAGNGTDDPGTTAQVGIASGMPLNPLGVAVTPNNGLLITSGHVVYRLQSPSTAS